MPSCYDIVLFSLLSFLWQLPTTKSLKYTISPLCCSEQGVRANFLHGRSGKSEGVEERAVAKNSEREDGWEWEDEPAVML